MKKLLGLISALAIGSISATSVVACGTPSNTKGSIDVIVDEVNHPSESTETKAKTDAEINVLHAFNDAIAKEHEAYKSVEQKGKDLVKDNEDFLKNILNK